LNGETDGNSILIVSALPSLPDDSDDVQFDKCEINSDDDEHLERNLGNVRPAVHRPILPRRGRGRKSLRSDGASVGWRIQMLRGVAESSNMQRALACQRFGHTR
jgi:hypothetical protein